MVVHLGNSNVPVCGFVVLYADAGLEGEAVGYKALEQVAIAEDFNLLERVFAHDIDVQFFVAGPWYG